MVASAFTYQSILLTLKHGFPHKIREKMLCTFHTHFTQQVKIPSLFTVFISLAIYKNNEVPMVVGFEQCAPSEFYLIAFACVDLDQ